MMAWTRVVAATLFAAVANAGLMASTTRDLSDLVLLPVPSALLVPGIVFIGMLLTLIVGDVGRSAVALLASSALGTLLFGLAIAAPGFAVEEVQVTLIDRGTTYGLLALMLFLLFGMAGMVAAWFIGTVLLTGDES